MKFFILLLAVVAFTHAEFSKEEDDRWVKFKLEHGKLFLSPGKEKARKETFLKVAREIDEHNEKFLRGEVTFSQKVNQYSDIPEDVFMERMAGTVMPAETRSEDERITLRQAPPASLDLRGSAGIGPVRNQSPCGSCWAFCTVAAMEYGYWRYTNTQIDLSEQQVVDCTYTDGRDSCKGGWITNAFDFARNGVLREFEYAYTNPTVSGVCKTMTNLQRYLYTASTSNVWINADDTSIKNALNQYGVLSVCVDASYWQRDSVGIYVAPNASGTLICNHGVALVGYGTASGIPYWIIRNSWGTTFANAGYIYLSAQKLANGNVAGGIFLNAVYAPNFY